MNRNIYQIFKDCFSELPITEDIFNKLLEPEKCDILEIYEQGELIGFSAVQKNCIRLLCVHPNYQHRGYGRQLVLESEKFIRNSGYNTVILGGTDSKLFIGALTDEKEWVQRKNLFFEKCGYTAANGCLEMIMPLANYDMDNIDISMFPKNVTFEYWKKEDKIELLSAVREVEEDWVKYYEYDNPIFVALDKGRCIGFTILNFDVVTLCSDGYKIVGTVGCVGVIPSSRNQGIGLAMVAHATNELKKAGCDLSYIHYTYIWTNGMGGWAISPFYGSGSAVRAWTNPGSVETADLCKKCRFIINLKRRLRNQKGMRLITKSYFLFCFHELQNSP